MTYDFPAFAILDCNVDLWKAVYLLKRVTRNFSSTFIDKSRDKRRRKTGKRGAQREKSTHLFAFLAVSVDDGNSLKISLYFFEITFFLHIKFRLNLFPLQL